MEQTVIAGSLLKAIGWGLMASCPSDLTLGLSGYISTLSGELQRRAMTYDYVCTACEHAWELEQRITEDPVRDCPNCHQVTAKRQISGGQGFILKGGGWYSDLYSSAKPAAAADSAKESKSDSKKESKPESKSEKTASPCASGACGTSACPATSSTN